MVGSNDINLKLNQLISLSPTPLGMPSVITYSIPAPGLWTGMSAGEACRKLEEAGASVVGLNCGRGPATMLPILREIRQACKVVLMTLLPSESEQHELLLSGSI